MSELKLLKDILPEVLAGILARCDRYRVAHGLPLISETLFLKEQKTKITKATVCK